MAAEAFAARAGIPPGSFALRGPILSPHHAVHISRDPITAANHARAILDSRSYICWTLVPDDARPRPGDPDSSAPRHASPRRPPSPLYRPRPPQRTQGRTTALPSLTTRSSPTRRPPPRVCRPRRRPRPRPRRTTTRARRQLPCTPPGSAPWTARPALPLPLPSSRPCWRSARLDPHHLERPRACPRRRAARATQGAPSLATRAQGRRYDGPGNPRLTDGARTRRGALRHYPCRMRLSRGYPWRGRRHDPRQPLLHPTGWRYADRHARTRHRAWAHPSAATTPPARASSTYTTAASPTRRSTSFTRRSRPAFPPTPPLPSQSQPGTSTFLRRTLSPHTSPPAATSADTSRRPAALIGSRC